MINSDADSRGIISSIKKLKTAEVSVTETAPAKISPAYKTYNSNTTNDSKLFVLLSLPANNMVFLLSHSLLVNSPLLTCLCFLLLNTTTRADGPAGDPLSGRVWRGTPGNESAWPEDELIDGMKDKKPTAFTCAGNGAKAFTACTGYMRGVHLLIEKMNELPPAPSASEAPPPSKKHHLPKWLLGVSGGAWFSAVYTYAKRLDGDDPISDIDLLGGRYIPPNELTRQHLQTIPKHSMLVSPTLPARKEIIKIFSKGAGWKEFVQRTYLSPNGIPEDAVMGWIENDKKNPPRFDALHDPNGKRPFYVYARAGCKQPYLIMGSALHSPTSTLTTNADQLMWTDMTPLYTGHPGLRQYNCTGQCCCGELGGCFSRFLPASGEKKIVVGGFVETHLWSSTGPSHEEPADVREDHEEPAVRVNVKSSPLSNWMQGKNHNYPFGVASALTHSSWAPGSLIHEELPRPVPSLPLWRAPCAKVGLLCARSLSPLLVSNALLAHLKELGNAINYWSPSEMMDVVGDHHHAVVETPFVSVDAGASENSGIPSALRRGARRIVSFLHPDMPLAPLSMWNPHHRPPSLNGTDCDHEFVDKFGYFLKTDAGIHENRNQVFRKKDLGKVISTLNVSGLQPDAGWGGNNTEIISGSIWPQLLMILAQIPPNAEG